MKKIFTLLLILASLRSMAQTPQMKVFFVDSAGYNQIAAWLLPQVAISGYYENLLHIPSISINGISHSVTNGQTWTLPTGGTVTSITPGYGHTSSTPITTAGTLTIDTSSAGLQTKAGINRLGINQLSKTANYTIVSADFAAGKLPILYLSVDCTSGNLTETLPSATTFSGYKVYITKTDATANYITISGLTGDNLLGSKGWVKELIAVGGTWTQN